MVAYPAIGPTSANTGCIRESQNPTFLGLISKASIAFAMAGVGIFFNSSRTFPETFANSAAKRINPFLRFMALPLIIPLTVKNRLIRLIMNLHVYL